MKYLTEKKQLHQFLLNRGVKYDKKKKTWQCPNPSHKDVHPSCTLYDKQEIPRLYCPICCNSEEKTWSVIEVCGLLDGLTNFADKLKAVRKTLNITEIDVTSRDEIGTSSALKIKQTKNPLPFPPEKTKEFNNKIKSLAIEKNWGENVGSWKYYNENNQVVALDVRFEQEGQRKNIITFWYDGKFKWYGAPVFIYNLQLLGIHTKNTAWPVLIHEGSKCADIGDDKLIDNFISLSWSGGSGKSHLADWSPLKDFDVYIMRDNDEPGLKAARKIKEQLPHAKIIQPPTTGKGDDIEQFLQKLTPDELTDYILSQHIESPEVGPSAPPDTSLSTNHDGPPAGHDSDGSTSVDSLPFKILGIGDDDKAAFITAEGRFKKYSLDGLSKQKLMVICDRDFWCREYKSNDGKVSWDMAIDEMIRLSQARDFDESTIRGRGAWIDENKISYHDGVKTYGECDLKKIYLRLPRMDIGIGHEPVNRDLPPKIKNLVFDMSFETPADAVRCLAWSVLAPFAGALEYRPAMLLTGPSASGKSRVQSLIIKRLSNCLWIDATESSVAGVRGKIQKDSGAIFFEEAEKDTEKKKVNIGNIYSLMRTNYTSDAPDTIKGTADGKYVSYKMNSMFGFASIDPTVDSIADENRIFRINMVKPTNGSRWKNIENELIKLLSKENCDGIRALTWRKLTTIFELTERIVDKIRDITGRDRRSSSADGLLASAFMVIWAGNDNPTDKQITNMLEKYYSYHAPEEHRDEAEEMVQRIMSERIEILHTDGREKLTIMECISRIYYGKIQMSGADEQHISDIYIQDYKLHVARYGIRIVDNANIAFRNNHHELMRIIGRGPGYNKILARHHGLIEEQRNVYYFDSGSSPRSTIIKGILRKKREDMDTEEALEQLI